MVFLDEKSVTYNHSAIHPVSSVWHYSASSVLRKKETAYV